MLLFGSTKTAAGLFNSAREAPAAAVTPATVVPILEPINHHENISFQE